MFPWGDVRILVVDFNILVNPYLNINISLFKQYLGFIFPQNVRLDNPNIFWKLNAKNINQVMPLVLEHDRRYEVLHKEQEVEKVQSQKIQKWPKRKKGHVLFVLLFVLLAFCPYFCPKTRPSSRKKQKRTVSPPI